MSASDEKQRWKLIPYAESSEDRHFAEKFIQWNPMRHGIQRVDACRTKDGQLLLVELEDLNPYLSIQLLEEQKRQAFLEDFLQALRRCV